MKKLAVLVSCAASYLLMSATLSSAITIDYTLTHLGGSSYQYDYTVTNNGSLGGDIPLLLFDIAFDTTLYRESSLAVVSANGISTNWLEEFLASATGVPTMYNVLALSGGIPAGAGQAGFAVSFEWLDTAAAPGSQIFEIYDTLTFELIETGTTKPGIAPVPEPGTVVMLSAGLVGLALFYRKRSRL